MNYELGAGLRENFRGNKSSPRLAARDGMEQGPYEFRSYTIGAKG
jgi:hypothetical protein